MKTPREPKVIQQEYSELCCQVGDITWKIKKLNRDLDRIHTEIQRLDQEYIEATKTPKEETIHSEQEL